MSCVDICGIGALAIWLLCPSACLTASDAPRSELGTPPAGRLNLARSEKDAAGQPLGESKNPPLQISVSPQAIHGGIVIPALIITTTAHQFSFLPPRGWRVQSAASERRIRLIQPESDSLITIDFADESAQDALLLSAEALRKEFLTRYPNGKMVEEFSASVLGRTGSAFEVEWWTTPGGRQLTRAVFVPFLRGRLEFSLTAPADMARRSYQGFNQLLLSFRSAPLNAKLEIQPVQPE